MANSGRNLDEARPNAAPARFAFDGFVLDLDRGALLRDQVEVRLRAKSLDALAHLVKHAGRLVPKQELMDAVWPDTVVTDDSLVQCLMDIRRALGDAQGLVHTARGRGYRFDGAVHPDGSVPPTGAAERPADPPPVRVEDGPPARPFPSAMFSRWRIALGLGLMIFFAAAGTWLYLRNVRPPRHTEEARRAVAEADAARFSLTRDGLTRAVSGYERAIALDPLLAPAYVGLSDASTLLGVYGAVPPADTYPRARRAALRAVELDPMLATAHVALAHVRVQWDHDWAGAEDSYRRALALDPDAPRAHALYGVLLASLGRGDEGVREARTALALQPQSPLTNTMLGIVLYIAGRSEESIAQGRVALRFAPNSSLVHYWLAVALADVGRLDEAMREALASRQGEANLPAPIVGYIHGRAGRRAEARQVFGALVEARARGIYVPATDLALVAAGMGDRDAALTWLEAADEEHAKGMETLGIIQPFAALRGDPRFRTLLTRLHLPAPH